jgi:fatty acid desaturase
MGWFMHECGHGSMTGNLTKDKVLQEIAFAIGNTCSGSYWNNQHNKHHACPQKLQHDVYIFRVRFTILFFFFEMSYL